MIEKAADTSVSAAWWSIRNQRRTLRRINTPVSKRHFNLIQRHILHAASDYAGHLCQTILRKREALPGVACRVEEALAESICHLNNDLLDQVTALKTVINTVPADVSHEELLRYYHDVVFADMNKVRATIDHLETLVAADYWPFPNYYDLLFYA